MKWRNLKPVYRFEIVLAAAKIASGKRLTVNVWNNPQY
jgi:hypothetical protein